MEKALRPLDPSGVIAPSVGKRSFRPAGWESWYSYYNNIDAKIITKEIEMFKKATTVAKLQAKETKQPIVF